MKKRDLQKPVHNPDFIPGIYNYCDRWCERCAFTARCRQYAMEQEQRRQGAKGSADHQAFWKNLEASLAQTRDLIADLAKEQGVDLDTPARGKLPHRQQKKSGNAGRHPIVKAAQEYSILVDDWFKENEASLRDKEEEIFAQATLGVGGVREEIASLTDVVEILRWYQHQIHAKLMRAFSAAFEGEADANPPKDSDGSAKVALIAMDRSIAAWLRLRDFFPARADSILTLLVQLDRLRRASEREFPDARRFVRPGFDSGEART
jgi:hypothetical protein